MEDRWELATLMEMPEIESLMQSGVTSERAEKEDKSSSVCSAPAMSWASGSNSSTVEDEATSQQINVHQVSVISETTNFRGNFTELLTTNESMLGKGPIMQPEDPLYSIKCNPPSRPGCTTNQRSVTERVRRVRINEKLKELQSLVPTTSKDDNTIVMLDKVSAYVKMLEETVQVASKGKATYWK